jgi:hypothetical protein
MDAGSFSSLTAHLKTHLIRSTCLLMYLRDQFSSIMCVRKPLSAKGPKFSADVLPHHFRNGRNACRKFFRSLVAVLLGLR